MRRFNFGRDKKEEEEKGLGLIPFKRFDIDSLLEDFFTVPFGFSFSKALKTPAVDIYEKGDKLIVKADLPGIKKEDIKLNIDKDILTISGETKRGKEVKKEDYYYSERSFGRIQRSIRLPEGTKPEEVKASYRDGVLNIELPKPKEVKEKGSDVEVE